MYRPINMPILQQWWWGQDYCFQMSTIKFEYCISCQNSEVKETTFQLFIFTILLLDCKRYDHVSEECSNCALIHCAIIFFWILFWGHSWRSHVLISSWKWWKIHNSIHKQVIFYLIACMHPPTTLEWLMYTQAIYFTQYSKIVQLWFIYILVQL